MSKELKLTYRIVVDEDPDLSWLDQTDEQMGEGFEAASIKRIEAYGYNMWEMVGVVVELSWHGVVFESASLWGIESDSDDTYFDEIVTELTDELIGEAIKI